MMILQRVILISLLLILGNFFILSDLSFAYTYIDKKEISILLQLFENCNNGIDDDGDGLIDYIDIFDCL